VSEGATVGHLDSLERRIHPAEVLENRCAAG